MALVQRRSEQFGWGSVGKKRKEKKRKEKKRKEKEKEKKRKEEEEFRVCASGGEGRDQFQAREKESWVTSTPAFFSALKYSIPSSESMSKPATTI